MRLGLACVLAMVMGASPAAAQVATGRIDAVITDNSGAILPNAEVRIDGPETHAGTTDAVGEAHFLNLTPGTYSLTAKHAGFNNYLNHRVPVTAGASVQLKIALDIAGIVTQVQVNNDTPVVDVKKTTTSTTISLDELQDVPSSRDPWSVLQSIPGVIIDRVNVGGAESGQQPAYLAKGAQLADNTWNIDGIVITDMAATGTSPAYYDFDMFQEMQVTTGGADVQSLTGGVQLNLILKSGTNTFRGSSRIYVENEGLEANNMSPQLSSSIGGTSGQGNRTHQYDDYGAEAGGPLVPNRLFGWAAASKTHIDIITLTGGHDRTELQDDSFKLTGQASDALRASFSYFRSNKDKFGRDAGPTRPADTTLDQRGPIDLYKGEGDLVLGDAFFVSARAAHLAGGFSLLPEGGLAQNWYIDDSGINHGSFLAQTNDRPQTTVSLDANTFRAHHEWKFGLGWRTTDITVANIYPGNGIVTVHEGYPEMQALVTRNYASETSGNYFDAYAGDTWTRDRLTLNLGVRWDRQTSSLGAGSVAASAVLPSLLPAISTLPVSNAVVWSSVTPRIGATYALNADRTTIARVSYAMFASQLSAGTAGVISSIQPSGIYYQAIDLNGNHVADPNELLLANGNKGFFGFDPNNPGRTTTLNQIGKYSTPMTQEFQIGADHEIAADFGVSATLTYRYLDNFDWQSLIGVSRADYAQTGTLVGSAAPVGDFSVPFYALNSAAVPSGGGSSFETHQGYHQRYTGLEVSGTKRLSQGWMARLAFSTNSDREYFSGAQAIDDPTPSPGAPDINGGLVVTPAAGSGKSTIFMVLPRYQIIATGMVKVPFGFNLGVNGLLRQGYAEPYYESGIPTGDPLGNLKSVLLVHDVGANRLPHVSSLDLRLDRPLTVRHAAINLDLDVFNVANRGTVLGRDYDLRLSGPLGFNQTLEIMDPLIVRLGARVAF